MYPRTYDGSGFSPLNPITPRCSRTYLGLVDDADQLGAHETTPIVNRGRMLVTTPQNNIIALDAKQASNSGGTSGMPDGLFQLPSDTNRGVALSGDYVYMATTDCALVALDAATGKEVWTVAIDDQSWLLLDLGAGLRVRKEDHRRLLGGELGVRG